MFIRFNETSQVWEYDTSPGKTGAGPWLILPNTPFLNNANIFTKDQEIRGANPSLQIYDSSRPINTRRFQVINTSSFLYLQAVSDAIDASHGYTRIARDGSIYNTGNIACNGTIIERNRSVPIGEWISYTPTFKGHGTDGAIGNGSMTAKYMLNGKTIFYQIRMGTGSTTVFPTGIYWGFSLPPGYGIEGVRLSMGSGFIYYAGGATYTIGAINGGFVSTPLINCIVLVVNTGSSAPFLTTGVPFAWGAGSWLTIDGNYEYI